MPTKLSESRATLRNSAARLARSFPPSAACKSLDLLPVNLRNLHLHLMKNPFAGQPLHLCAVPPRNRVRFFESVRRKNLPAHSGAAGMDEDLITCGGQPQDCEPSLVKSTRNARSDSSVKQKYMIKSHNSVIFRLTKREFAV